MVLLDTCVIVWWTIAPDKLSLAAASECARAQFNGIGISATLIWEIGLKIKKGNLKLGLSIEQFLYRLGSTQLVKIIPVDEKILVENLNLSWPHKDPSDRTIVATARLFNCPLLHQAQRYARFTLDPFGNPPEYLDPVVRIVRNLTLP